MLVVKSDKWKGGGGVDTEGGSSKISHFLVTLFLNGSLSNEFDQIC